MRITEAQLRKLVRRQLIKEREGELIREYLRASLSARKRHLNESITAAEILEELQKILYIMAAKEAGGKLWEAVKEEFGEKIVEGIVKLVGMIPLAGNIISGAAAVVGFIKGGFNVFKKTKEAKEASYKLLDMAAGEYGTDIDDEKAEKDPFAKILNIDDRMEAPLKQQFLQKFLSTYIKYLKTHPEMTFSSRQSAAEETLERYMKTIGQYEDVKGPPDPL